MSYRISLIGGPRDGEVIETRLPPYDGTELTITAGRYVVLGDLDRGIYAAAYYTPNSEPAPSRPSPLDEDQPIGRAVLGAIGGLMWGGVIFATLGIWAVGGWLIDELAARVGYTNLTITLLVGGAIVGAIAGYHDAKGTP